MFLSIISKSDSNNMNPLRHCYYYSCGINDSILLELYTFYRSWCKQLLRQCSGSQQKDMTSGLGSQTCVFLFLHDLHFCILGLPIENMEAGGFV